MKLLITTDTYKPMVNGVIISIDNLAEELRKKGHQVRILALSESRAGRKEGDVYYLPSHKAFVYPGARWTMAFSHPYMKEILAWKPDIVHSQSEFFSFRAARIVVNTLHIPHVHTYHTMWEDYTSYVIPIKRVGKVAVSRYIRFAMKKIDLIITPTPKVARALKNYGICAPMVSVPTGIDLSRFREEMPMEARIRLREKLGISDKDTVFLFLGRVGYEKNIDMLIRLLKPVMDRKKDQKFLIVGDGPEREKLTQLVKREGLSGQVLFTGMVPQEQVKDYYKIADIFINASQSETQGLTYMEALASGLPTVCLFDPCLEGVIENGKNGYLFRSEQEFSEKIHEILTVPGLREKLSVQAKQSVERYSRETFGNRMERLMLSLVERTKEV